MGYDLRKMKAGVGWGTTPAFGMDKLPRACLRQRQNFDRCMNIEGDKGLCHPEFKNFLEICPTWALENIAEKKRWTLKHNAIQNRDYKEAL